MKIGEGDVQMQWLLTSLRVERWREALLWTWVVANMGTISGSHDRWDDATRTAIKDMFGFTENDNDVVKIEVHRGERWTLEPGRMQKAFEQAGWEAPKATEFLFCKLPLLYLKCTCCLFNDSLDGRYYASATQAW